MPDIPATTPTTPAANLIRVAKDGNKWLAWIGDDAVRGEMATGDHPYQALEALTRKLYRVGWKFDDA